MGLKKYQLKPASAQPAEFHSAHAPNGIWYVATMTDEHAETLREHDPATFDTYFETVKISKNEQKG